MLSGQVSVPEERTAPSHQHPNKKQASFPRTGIAPWNLQIRASAQDETMFTLTSPPKPRSNKQ